MFNIFKKIDLYNINFKKLSTLEIDEVISQMKKQSFEEREKLILHIFDEYSSYEVRTGVLGYILNQFKDDIITIFEKESRK